MRALTDRKPDPAEAPDGPPSDPATISSIVAVDGGQETAVATRSVPTVGHWVGPSDDPARYERLEHVGGGAEGAIFRARRVGPAGESEPVALKEYRPPPGAPPTWPRDGTWRQIEHQAWMLRGLPRTDHLVRVRDEFLGATSGPGLGGDPQSRNKAFETPFVVMEWIEGVRPDVLLRAGGTDLPERASWVRDLAEAVDLLHSVSRTDRYPLVHGDVKPGNCLITPDRGLVLVDTGALQMADGAGEFRGLRSPPYAAPEVLTGPGRRRSTATDLYSLGAVAYFLLTMTEPPDAAHTGYVELARADLLRCAAITQEVRGEVAAHVLRLLAPDPEQRTRTSARRWAEELTGLLEQAPPAGRASRRRRSAVLIGGAAVLAAAAVATSLSAVGGSGAPGTLPGTAVAGTAVGPSVAASTTPAPASWPRKAFADLPVFTAGGGRSLYEHTFTTPTRDWPAARQAAYATSYGDGGYDVQVLDRGVYQPIPGPETGSVSDEVVSATATMRSGQGGWGVWCRGTDTDGFERYSFLLSHAGAVQIIGSDGGGTGWVYVDGLDLAEPVTLAARCADVAEGPVELTLAVNGRVALTFRPALQGVLGPGYAGLEGMTFADVNGPTLTAVFQHFDIRRATR